MLSSSWSQVWDSAYEGLRVVLSMTETISLQFAATSVVSVGLSTSETIGLSGTLTMIVIFYSIYRFIYNLYFHPLAKFPGPWLATTTKLPIAYYTWHGQASQWIHALHEYYDSDVIRFSPSELNFIAPEAWNDIYSSTKANGSFQRDLGIMADMETNILTANDHDHRRLRRSITQAFSERALREQEQILLFHVRKFIEKLSEAVVPESGFGKVNVQERFMFLIFDIVSDLAFGSSFNCQENVKYHPWVENMFSNLQTIILVSVTQRFPPLTKLLGYFIPKEKIEARRKHERWTAEQIDHRLNLETTRPDFLTYITRHSQGSEKDQLTKKEIDGLGEIIMGAGTDTTATSLTSFTYFLLMHPQHHQRLVQDVRSSFSSVEEISTQTVIDRLPFLQIFLEENFRMFPLALIGGSRIVPPGGAYVAGHFVAGGTSVIVNQWTANRSSRRFTKPDDFIPERWMEGEKGKPWKTDDRDVVQTFGIGPRNCVGKKYVSIWFYMKVFLGPCPRSPCLTWKISAIQR